MEKYRCANCGNEAQEQQICCGQPMQVVSEEAQETTQATEEESQESTTETSETENAGQ